MPKLGRIASAFARLALLYQLPETNDEIRFISPQLDARRPDFLSL